MDELVEASKVILEQRDALRRQVQDMELQRANLLAEQDHSIKEKQELCTERMILKVQLTTIKADRKTIKEELEREENKHLDCRLHNDALNTEVEWLRVQNQGICIKLAIADKENTDLEAKLDEWRVSANHDLDGPDDVDVERMQSTADHDPEAMPNG